MTEYKNRIIGSGEEPLDQILFNPRNWRVHPLNQQNALKGVLEEVGWVQEVIINQRTGHLVDGHLRCQLAAREGAKTIPVKYVDLSEEEEAQIQKAYEKGKRAIFNVPRRELVYQMSEQFKRFRYRDWETDRKSTRLNSSHSGESRMPSSA